MGDEQGRWNGRDVGDRREKGSESNKEVERGKGGEERCTEVRESGRGRGAGSSKNKEGQRVGEEREETQEGEQERRGAWRERGGEG